MIPREYIESLLAQIDLRDLASRYGQLHGNGAERKQLCVFHAESTPSLSIGPSRYYCYGCGSKGRAVDYLQKVESLGFREAVAALAQFAGFAPPQNSSLPAKSLAAKSLAAMVCTPQSPSPTPADDQPMIGPDSGAWAELLAFGQQAYVAGLADDPIAQNYLRLRGICPETSAIFGIGATSRVPAVDEFHTRSADAAKKGGYKFATPHPCYLALPIRCADGLVRGFAYRAYCEPGPGHTTHTNSASAPHFKKSQLLFGFHESLPVAKRVNAIVLVEGPFDALACHQHGLTSAAAALTRSLSAAQLELVFTAAETLYLSLDGDAPGQAGMEKTVLLAAPLLTGNRAIRWVQLPPETDPSDFIAAHGIEAFANLCRDSACGFQQLLANRIAAARQAAGTAPFDAASDECLGPLREQFSQLPDGATRTGLFQFLCAIFPNREPFKKALINLGLLPHQASLNR